MDAAEEVDVTVGFPGSGSPTDVGTYTAKAQSLSGAQAANYELPTAADKRTTQYTINPASIQGHVGVQFDDVNNNGKVDADIAGANAADYVITTQDVGASLLAAGYVFRKSRIRILDKPL